MEIEKNKIEVLKFILAGLCCAGIEYLAFTVLLHTRKVNYLIANVTSICVSLSFNYLLSKYFTFKKENNTAQKELLSFAVFSVLALILNQIILYCCFEGIKLTLSLSKLIAICNVSVFNYLTKKYFVFKKI